jgi:hypothetical protein
MISAASDGELRRHQVDVGVLRTTPSPCTERARIAGRQVF